MAKSGRSRASERDQTARFYNFRIASKVGSFSAASQKNRSALVTRSLLADCLSGARGAFSLLHHATHSASLLLLHRRTHLAFHSLRFTSLHFLRVTCSPGVHNPASFALRIEQRIRCESMDDSASTIEVICCTYEFAGGKEVFIHPIRVGDTIASLWILIIQREAITSIAE